MGQKERDGITIDNTVYMMDGKGKGFPISLRFVQWLFLLIGSYGGVFLFVETFSLSVDRSVIRLVIFLISIVIYFFMLYPYYDWTKIALVAFIYLFLMKRWLKALQNGFYILENAIIENASEYYQFSATYYKASYRSAREDMTLLIIMIVIPMIILLSYSLIRCKWINVTALVLLLPVAASFAFGITPPELYIIAYITTMLFLSRSYGLGRSSSYKEQRFMIHRNNSRSALVLALIVLMLFSMMKLIVTERRYDETNKIEEVKYQLQDYIMNFSIEDVSDRFKGMNIFPAKGNLGSGGINSGKLGSVDAVRFNNSEQLILRVPADSIREGIYLKGYVGAVYTGDRWEGHTKSMKNRYTKLLQELEENYQPVNGAVSLIQDITEMKKLNRLSSSYIMPENDNDYSLKKGDIEIKYVDANKKYIYAPYLTDFENESTIKYEYDLYAAPNEKLEEYEFIYYFGLDMKKIPLGSTNIDTFGESERLYRKFVYDAYTQMPKTGLDRIKEDFDRDDIGERVDTTEKAVAYVKDYLESNTSYTLSPGRLPKNKDFVEYFIYESKVGYCSHYASAGVMMLRALGYPARYVEGYAVDSSDIDYQKRFGRRKVESYTNNNITRGLYDYIEVSVKDDAAHAWAEVYIDGVGWFPVEFTSSVGLDGTGEVLRDMSGISDDITRDESETPTPTPKPTSKPTMTPIPKEEAEKSELPKVTEGPIRKEENGKVIPNEMTTEKAILRIIVIVIAVVILLITVFIIVRLMHRRNLGAYMDNRSKRAILIYRELERFLRALKVLPKWNSCLEDQLDLASENCPYIDKQELDSIMDAVKKARFGREVISQSELQRIESFYDKLYKQSSSELPSWKRRHYKIYITNL